MLSPAKLHETLAPDWDEIERLRRSAHIFMEEAGVKTATAQAVEMVLSELMENAVKYGAFSKQHNQITFDVELMGDVIVIEVTNPVTDKNLAHLKVLDRTIQWIRGFQDPFEAYVERVQEVAQKPMDDKTSGLGVVRVAYEGGAVLDFFLDEDSILKVSAVVACN